MTREKPSPPAGHINITVECAFHGFEMWRSALKFNASRRNKTFSFLVIILIIVD